MKIRNFLSVVLFAGVALLSFAVWAIGGAAFSSEVRMYLGCAVVFLGLGGASLLPAAGLSRPRDAVFFCLRFAAGFLVYAFLWTVAWFTLRDTFGEVAGSFAGLLAATAIWRAGRPSPHGLFTATAIVFLCHTLGYYAGGMAYQSLQNRGVLAVELPWDRETVVTLARFAWGLGYGLGLGAGLVRVLQEGR